MALSDADVQKQVIIKIYFRILYFKSESCEILQVTKEK